MAGLLNAYNDYSKIMLTFASLSILLIVQLVSCCDHTPPVEVQALRDAAKDLGKLDWNCSEDPCTVGADGKPAETCWFTKRDATQSSYANQVTCYCYNSQMHVTNISLKEQNLVGRLPRSLAKLRYLTTIDLSRNLLTGSIPPEWASMQKLRYLSLMANNLSGQIPGYLGNITTLTYLSFESNRFSGAVPAQLGQLVNLEHLLLDDNNLTGELPLELKKLRNLTELDISSNYFTGRLPDYFGSWAKLQNLAIQGSGFEGPIPSSISLLRNASQLRISDLSGEGSSFPSLANLTNLTKLVLRNCNIFGSIPTYITKLPLLSMLDLSFNNLTGHIPPSGSSKLQNLYLMHNMLTGSIPSWTENSKSKVDLSYNLLNETGLTSANCSNDCINLYRSFSVDRNLGSIRCLELENSKCSKARYSLYINCGGEKLSVNKTTYEQDNKEEGVAKFYQASEWGFSSSGEYWNTNDKGYTASISTPGTTHSDLFTEARPSATSLTYYGRCLAKGNYTVALLFSEIIFANDTSFSSLGRRKFDIYIQEKRRRKDFDIAKEANGNGKPVKLEFRGILVNSTIEIRFYYAGKGSTAIPSRETGAYGPLISAISVKSEFRAPLDRETIMWISIGVTGSLMCFFIVSLAIVHWKHRSENIMSREEDLFGLDLHTGKFTFRQIKAATNNFDAACKIGEGGFGSVYLGTLLDGTHIAVKKLSSKSSQGHREFVNEVGMISGLHHPNLVKLYGCCVEGSQLFLIYEYMANNNLARALFGTNDSQMRLDWPTRQRICIGIARGLTFLHEESTIKVVHRDIKATNILLDRDLNPKISDFGLARLDEEEKTHVSTRVAGTIGYMAPEYALWGYLTYKADVYSFGVVLLEVFAGSSNMKFRQDGDHFCLQDRAFVLQQQKGNLMNLLDPRLGTEYNEEEALTMIKVALLCTNPSPALRPTMSSVLRMLEGKIPVEESTFDPAMHSHEWLYQASRRQHDQMAENETQSLILSAGAPPYNSSSAPDHHDLYPVDPHSH